MTRTKSNLIISMLLVCIAASLKALTHPHSIDPIIAISLFSGCLITDRKLAFAIPLLAMFVSDIILEVFNIAPGFYGMSQIGNYLSLLFVTLLGFGMKKINIFSIVGFSIASSLLFFLLSNSNCFLFDNSNFYGSGIAGWAKCLSAGLPFLRNGMAIDLVFSLCLFGGYQLWASRKMMASSVKK